MVKVKLLNTDLIRTLGGVFVNMDDSQAVKYVNNGKAKIVKVIESNSLIKGKRQNNEVDNKSTWIPPESKLFDKEKKEVKDIYPKPEDKLFAQIRD